MLQITISQKQSRFNIQQLSDKICYIKIKFRQSVNYEIQHELNYYFSISQEKKQLEKLIIIQKKLKTTFK